MFFSECKFYDGKESTLKWKVRSCIAYIYNQNLENICFFVLCSMTFFYCNIRRSVLWDECPGVENYFRNLCLVSKEPWEWKCVFFLTLCPCSLPRNGWIFFYEPKNIGQSCTNVSVLSLNFFELLEVMFF